MGPLQLIAPCGYLVVNLYPRSPDDRYRLRFLRNDVPVYQAAIIPAYYIWPNKFQNARSLIFCAAELNLLHLQANDEVASLRDKKLVLWDEVTVLSRVEPNDYYDKILKSEKYPGIEWPYIKNNNGHSESPINNRLYGLFMSAGLVGTSSPFGGVGYEYDIKVLLANILEYHLYLADFYCTKNSTNHKITLVICRIGYIADMFCEKVGLVKLDWRNNPYFKVDGNNKFYVARGTGPGSIFIDIYYTEPLFLDKGVRRENITSDGDMIYNRMNRIYLGGVKSNPHCNKCNVDLCA